MVPLTLGCTLLIIVSLMPFLNRLRYPIRCQNMRQRLKGWINVKHMNKINMFYLEKVKSFYFLSGTIFFFTQTISKSGNRPCFQPSAEPAMFAPWHVLCKWQHWTTKKNHLRNRCLLNSSVLWNKRLSNPCLLRHCRVYKKLFWSSENHQKKFF